MSSSLGRRQSTFGFEQTLMYGRYKEDLAQFAKNHASNLKSSSGQPQKKSQYSPPAFCSLLWKYTFAKVGDDWPFLALLGILMAVLSFLMDYFIHQLHKTQFILYDEALFGSSLLVQYLSWCILPLFLILFATGFSYIVSAQSIGSGIPEMKTILRGVVLEEYLTFQTLVAKIIGLTCTLGSGLPLGKEGPFVHIASIVASLFTKLIASFQETDASSESRSNDMLAVACAVGVAATFFAPIGGVLFSIEVTSVYFAVRNYWRGFFSACFGATIWRLFAVWFKDEESLTALHTTTFRSHFAFDPLELVVFAFIGILAGFGGVAYVKFHRAIVHFIRDHPKLNGWFKQNRFLYPGLMTLFLVTLSFPPFIGQFMASTLSTHHTLEDLFSNLSWTGNDTDSQRLQMVSRWSTDSSSIYLNLLIYILMMSFMAILATTIPVPSGTFIPVFKIGAALGRLVGELMVCLFPLGIPFGVSQPIVPGGYAVVGAAAFSGAVTQTISTTVIVFELTGQMTHMLPVIIAVLLANAISQSLDLSIYDSIIQIKQLPFLPPLPPTSSTAHSITVEDIMTSQMVFISRHSTYLHIRDRLQENARLQAFPLVDNALNMLLIGSIQRSQLERMIEEFLEQQKKLQKVGRHSLPGPSELKGQIWRNQCRRNGQMIDQRAFLRPSRFEGIFEDKEEGPLNRVVQNRERKVHFPTIRISDLSAEERQEWEEIQLDQTVNYVDCTIDPAPFQLVERTTLFKVHSLFSMMCLEGAYVTSIGRLVGVVMLKDLRIAIEKMNAGL